MASLRGADSVSLMVVDGAIVVMADVELPRCSGVQND